MLITTAWKTKHIQYVDNKKFNNIWHWPFYLLWYCIKCLRKWLLNVRAHHHLCKKKLNEGQAAPWPTEKEQKYKELRTKHYIEIWGSSYTTHTNTGSELMWAVPASLVAPVVLLL